MCLTDWHHEIGYVPVALFRSEAKLREHMHCVSGCGVVKLTIQAEVIQEPNNSLMADTESGA